MQLSFSRGLYIEFSFMVDILFLWNNLLRCSRVFTRACYHRLFSIYANVARRCTNIKILKHFVRKKKSVEIKFLFEKRISTLNCSKNLSMKEKVVRKIRTFRIIWIPYATVASSFVAICRRIELDHREFAPEPIIEQDKGSPKRRMSAANWLLFACKWNVYVRRKNPADWNTARNRYRWLILVSKETNSKCHSRARAFRSRIEEKNNCLFYAKKRREYD